MNERSVPFFGALIAVLLVLAAGGFCDEYDGVRGLHPQVAMATDGSYVVVWTDLAHIYAQRYDPTGARLGEEILVDKDIPTQNDDHPEVGAHDVAMSGAGDFLVAWESVGPNREMHLRLFRKDGTIAAEFPEQATWGVNKMRPAVAAASQGTFALAFLDLQGQDISARLFDATGNPLSAFFEVSTTSRPWEPAIALNDAGLFAAAYEDTRNTDDIMLVILDGQNPQFAERISFQESRNAAVAMNADGTIAVVWEEKANFFAAEGRILESNRKVMLAVYQSTGVVVRAPTVVNTDQLTSQALPDVFVDDTGGIVVTYTARQDDTVRVYSRRYHVTEDVIDDPLWVNEGVLPQFSNLNATVAAGGPDTYVTVWETVILDAGGEFDRFEIQSRIFSSNNDRDLDGVPDAQDNCPDDYNPSQRDSDSDGIADGCDPDIDGDTIPNDQDNCPLVQNTPQADTDSDGVGDACDNCPDEPNADQFDRDRDGIGDICDPCVFDASNDADNDGRCGYQDNCPNEPNQDQADTDRDNLGDACDNCPTVVNVDQKDTNENGVGDACEPFIRSDGNADGTVNISDAIWTLSFLFSGAPSFCDDALDANDDGIVNIADAVYTLQHLFAGGDAPPPPYLEPGIDPTRDPLGCAALVPPPGR